MNIQITQEEVGLLKQARDSGEWKNLPTWKLVFLYQKHVCLPGNDMKTLQEIAETARKENKRKGIDLIAELRRTYTKESLNQKYGVQKKI